MFSHALALAPAYVRRHTRKQRRKSSKIHSPGDLPLTHTKSTRLASNPGDARRRRPWWSPRAPPSWPIGQFSQWRLVGPSTTGRTWTTPAPGPDVVGASGQQRARSAPFPPGSLQLAQPKLQQREASERPRARRRNHRVFHFRAPCALPNQTNAHHIRHTCIAQRNDRAFDSTRLAACHRPVCVLVVEL